MRCALATFAAFLALLFGTPVHAEDSGLELRVSCADEPACTFAGSDMRVDVEIFNTGSQAIGVPLALLRQRGPTIKLTNSGTEDSVFLRPNLANPSLKADLVAFEPSDSATIPWVIMAVELRQFGQQVVDVIADVSFRFPGEVRGAPVDVRVSQSIRIRETDGQD